MASLAADPAARQPGVPQAAALYLAVIQFVFATMWIMYVIYLPGLLDAVGVPRDWLIWILMFDQALFMVMDVALGMAADRVARLYQRLAPRILAVTVVSCVAFLLLP